jgi:hypothetical protein
MRLLHHCHREVLVKAGQLLCCQQAQLGVEGRLQLLLQGLPQLVVVLSTHVGVKVHRLNLVPAGQRVAAATTAYRCWLNTAIMYTEG